MAKGRQQYFADEVSIQKEAREFAIEEQLKAKIDSVEEGAQVNVIETVKVNGDPLIPDAEKAVDVSVPLVEDTLYSVDTEAALSARQGKVLYDYILNLQSRGRYLSNWNCATGLPTTNPYDSPYEYRAGDYFLVNNVSTGTNYKPDGSEYVIGVASTTVETEIVGVSDMYIYDGETWQLIINSERPIAIDDALSPTSTNPVENRVVTQAIGTKQNIITDLQTIREGAAKGDTAVQPGDSLSTLSGDSDDIAEGSSHLFMTTSERTKLGNQSGVNTGDETQTTIKAKLGPASATTDGYLTSTDWNTFNDKQDAIQDLQTIRENATAGKNASDTIATYGDVVTHDVSEFATAAQGAKADTALQSGDNVSELVNDAGYITSAYHDDTKQDKLTAGDNVTIGEVCHRNTQGPCPDGFHIPTRWYRDDGIGVSDIGTLKGYLSALGVSGENMQVVLKNPTGHNRWQPWRDTSHSVGSRPQITRRGNGVDRSVYSMNTPTAIRSFKNDPVVPDNSWTILFDGSSIAVGAGVFWSEGLGLISISADGVNWITLADKNLGATQVYNQGDAFTAANTGNLYQWGNNFGRPYGTTPATTTEQVDASGYGPGNYYYREVQFTGDYWDSSVNSNLWGCPQWKGQIGTRCALTISANDTTYVASDFDIKDLADSTGKRAEWDAKQDALDLGANLSWGQDGKLNATDTTYTAGPGISISNNNVISNTQTSAEWGNITGTLSDQTDLQNALNAKQDELTAGDNITIENVCHKDTQGPCPDGFHVPTVNEWNGLIDIMKNALSLQYGPDWMQYLHMPYAGQRDCESSNVDRQRIEGFYATSIFDDTTPSFSGAFFLLVRAGDTVYVEEYGLPVAIGFSVRGFKNEYITPTSSWTVVQGTLGSAGIFRDQINGLISITNGTTGYTIMDKNLGATTVYNSGDTLSEANCGKYYQWGNNYGFPRSGSITTSSTQVDASGYGPGNYYSSSTFITTSTSPFDWSSVENKNLRGGVSQGQQCNLTISAQVPDSAEWGNITGTLSNQTDLQNALDGKVNLGNNKVYDNTVVEIGKWVHGESADASGHHITLDPNGEVSTYNVTVAGHNEATLGSGNLTLLENTALGGDETTVITQDGITVTEGQTTKTYDFLGNDRIATLSDISGSTGGLVDNTPYGSSWDGVTTIAPSKNAVYDKLNADLNTKTFSLSGTTGATAFAEAQEIYDWFAAGGTPIVQFDGKTYILYSSNSAGIYLKGTDLNNRSSNGYKVIGTPSLAIRVSSGDVTEIESANLQIGGFLNTLENGQVFTPQYDSQPATKKYVDDSIAGVPTYTAGAGINIDANNEVSNTLPGPVIAASAPTGTEGALWYDTTNNVLMAHDGTDWKEAGTQMKVLSYGHSTWQDFLDAYNENAIVYCKASSNSNPGSGNQGRMAFMAFIDINNTTQKIQGVEFQYYRSRNGHSTAATVLDEVYIYKLTPASGGTWTVTQRDTAAEPIAGTGIGLTYNASGMTIANTGVTSFNGDTGAITLTPGTYLSLNNNVIDVDTSLIATKADLANFAGFLVVAQLPTTDIKTNIIYLLGPVGTGADKYEEYIYSNNNWILIGDTSIDLSPYFHKTNDDSDDIIEGSTNLFLTTAERTKLTNTSGTNTGDETKATIQSKLGAASSSNSGYLTSTDYDTFNGKADAADVNTKLFRLESNQDLTTAQAVYDWRAAGKNPIITHGDGGMMRTLYSASTTRLEFVAEGYYSNGAVTPNGNISEKGLYVTYINANSSGVVTSINAGEKDYIRYLNTNVDYPTPYIPQYDGSPATKKYVDDAVAGGGGYRPIFFAGSSLADIGAALANYLNTYSITPSNLSDVGPIGIWEDGPYYLQGTPVITTDAQYRFTFQSPTTNTATRNNSYSWTNHPLRRFVMDWDSTNSVWSYNSSDTSYVQVTSYNYLRTDVNYATPYIPQYNGSPATKKYVDDTVAASISSAITNETAGTTSSINKIWVGTEAEYQAITTYDEHTAYMTF